MTYRCWCGHFEKEHTFSGGCAGCDAGGKSVDIIEHNYEADNDWPEDDPNFDMLLEDDDDFIMRREDARFRAYDEGMIWDDDH